MAQILAQMGMSTGDGPGVGLGSGGMGGMSARRGNFGLYGGLPGMPSRGGGSEADGRQRTEDDPGGNFAGTAGGQNPDRDSFIDEGLSGGASGIGEGAIPVRYRRPVGDYFQRVAEEVGER